MAVRPAHYPRSSLIKQQRTMNCCSAQHQRACTTVHRPRLYSVLQALSGQARHHGCHMEQVHLLCGACATTSGWALVAAGTQHASSGCGPSLLGPLHAWQPCAEHLRRRAGCAHEVPYIKTRSTRHAAAGRVRTTEPCLTGRNRVPRISCGREQKPEQTELSVAGSPYRRG